MKAIRACCSGLLIGLLVGAALFLFARLRFPAFLAAGGDAATLRLVVRLRRRRARPAPGRACSGGAASGSPAGSPSRRSRRTRRTLRRDAEPAVVGGAALVAGVVAGVASRGRSSRGRRGRIGLGVAALLLLVTGVSPLDRARRLRPPPLRAARLHPKLFVFGLDAGTWTILNELFHADRLPNLRPAARRRVERHPPLRRRVALADASGPRSPPASCRRSTACSTSSAARTST
jgi:hypothetical protein